MIAESLTTDLLHCALLALKPTERWSAARSPLQDSFSFEHWQTVFVVIAQIVSVAIIFWLMTKKKQVDRRSKLEVAHLTVTNEQLTREITELTQRIQTLMSEESPSQEQEDPEEVQASKEEPEESEEPVAVQ